VHITRAIRELDASGAASVEVKQTVHDDYNRTIDAKMAKTVWEVGGCTSFYRDATGRNATLYPDWTFRFRHDAKKWRKDAYLLAGATKSVPASAAR
jgi:cyclohexanone monooxygenase